MEWQSPAAVKTAQVEQHVPQTQGDTGSPELHELLWWIGLRATGGGDSHIYLYSSEFFL